METKKVLECVVLVENSGKMVISYTFEDKLNETVTFDNIYTTEQVDVNIVKKDANNRAVKDDAGKPVYLASAVITAEQYDEKYLAALVKGGLLREGTDIAINVKWKTNQQDCKRRLMQAELDGTIDLATIKAASRDTVKAALMLRLINGEVLTAEEQAVFAKK